MLTWYKGNRPNSFLGFDDDTLLYKVYNEGNGYGWEWEYVPDMDGFDGYETAEEAMTAAEADFASNQIEVDWEDLEPLDLEDLVDPNAPEGSGKFKTKEDAIESLP